MDANGTRFHLLFGNGDWSRALLEDASTSLGALWSKRPSADVLEALGAAAPVDDKRAPELSLPEKLARFVAKGADRPVDTRDRRGAARDRYGNWYVVSKDRLRIDVRSEGSDRVTPFWPPAAPAPAVAEPGQFQSAEPSTQPMVACSFQALTITRDHYLVAASTVDRRTELLVFDLFAGGPPQRLQWPSGVELQPWDLAPRDPGGFWLLDAAKGRLWEFNAHLQVVAGPRLSATCRADDFVNAPDPADSVLEDIHRARYPGPPRARKAYPIHALSLDHAIALLESEPVAVEPLPGGGALVLDAGGTAPSIGAYRGGARTGTASLAGLYDIIEVDRRRPEWTFIAHDFAILTEPGAEMAPAAKLPAPLLLVADREGNQAFCFALAVTQWGQPEVVAQSIFFPMRLFGGAALVASDGQAYYDALGRFVPLVAQARPRYTLRAVVVTPPLDGDTPACIWHRILFEGCIPSGTSIRLSSRATDADGAELAAPEGPALVSDALARLPWDDEPPPIVRASGSELPWLRAEATGGHDTWELLVQRAKGRYFQLRISLEGDGQHTPRVRALRAYYPRFSYLSHYLPACYAEDPTSASLVERLLANYEGLVTALEDRALALGTVCDPLAAPAELLDWLGRWYAVYLDPAWKPARKRLFLKHALSFFQWRGTARGLRTALRLVFDDCFDESIFTDAGDRGPSAQRYRITEEFRRRLLPRVQPVTLPQCHAFVPIASAPVPWQAKDGVEALHRRWRAAAGLDSGEFPLLPPTGAELAAHWGSFCQDALGFEPSTSAGDAPAWQNFLRRRYASFGEARATWGEALGENEQAFGELILPVELPASVRALDDWQVFHRCLLPMRAAAHRFSVSLPVAPQRARDAEKLRAGLHLADRLIALEKPAHSAYRVELYWALFRVGSVRLGSDTEISQGSRLPELSPPLVLDEGALAEGRLSPRPEDWNRGRVELGRNPLGRSRTFSSFRDPTNSASAKS